jgi:hypothetical protein
VFELVAVRGELAGDDRKERAVMDEPSAGVRLDADGGRAVGDVGCPGAAVGRARADVLCAPAAVVGAVSADAERRAETRGTLAADVCESAAVADGMSATDVEVRDCRRKGAVYI